MISIVAIHGMPKDSQAFDSHYENVHTPLVQRIPGVVNIRYGHVLQRPDAESSNYLICDTYFADEASLQKALASPEMADALADVPNFSTGGVTIFFADVADYSPQPSAASAGGPA